MTACAVETIPDDGGTAGHTGFVIAADGSYAARLTPHAGPEGGWCPERWTMDGPEPYAVPLPADRPEDPSSEVLPLADGRVLIARRVERRHQLTLLYPSGPDTGEVPLGAVDSERLTLLPPTPGGRLVYALAPGAHATVVWLVAGGAFGPQQVAEVSGRCSGGAWLDPEGRLLALDRTEQTAGGSARTKTVAVDLGRGGEVTPLLQIAEESDDRLLLADPDSGLLLVRSDAPGEDRLGWGVLGSRLPVRFPEALRPDDARLTPFAVQPGQALLPESCAVGLRADGPNGTWVAVWRPAQRTLQHIPAPQGWLAGKGVWTAGGELRLPYATEQTPCGLARVRVGPPDTADEATGPGGAREPAEGPAHGPAPARGPDGGWDRGTDRERDRGPDGADGRTRRDTPVPARPVPLQQAPMART